jgi:hypothetical protein
MGMANNRCRWDDVCNCYLNLEPMFLVRMKNGVIARGSNGVGVEHDRHIDRHQIGTKQLTVSFF